MTQPGCSTPSRRCCRHERGPPLRCRPDPAQQPEGRPAWSATPTPRWPTRRAVRRHAAVVADHAVRRDQGRAPPPMMIGSVTRPLRRPPPGEGGGPGRAVPRRRGPPEDGLAVQGPAAAPVRAPRGAPVDRARHGPGPVAEQGRPRRPDADLRAFPAAHGAAAGVLRRDTARTGRGPLDSTHIVVERSRCSPIGEGGTGAGTRGCGGQCLGGRRGHRHTPKGCPSDTAVLPGSRQGRSTAKCGQMSPGWHRPRPTTGSEPAETTQSWR